MPFPTSFDPMLDIDPLAPVAEIMLRHGALCTPSEFHAAVNVTFHRFESEHYDELHQSMWDSLPAEVNYLAEDCIAAGAPDRIRMLDIGCGTGLATDCLLKTRLGQRVETVDLIDTSPAMLSRVKARREQWGKPGETMEGLVESLAGKKKYDLIITCSVLHHVPDLASFLGAVTQLQEPGGCFLHLQDPNWDYLNDAKLQERLAEMQQKLPDWLARLKPSRILGRLAREIKGEQGRDYISLTNEELLRQGLVKTPLATQEIYAITDIHAHDGAGISIEKMKPWLSEYELVSRRSYAFYGPQASELPPQQKVEEEKLSREKALNGSTVSACWKRR
jgi:2-polyprenyl-3-methyl-5-hydroxy-6-metoxy-1,4-benzoquinol methylase